MELKQIKEITRNDIVGGKRNLPLWQLTYRDVENYTEPCLLKDSDEDWDWTILDKDFEEAINKEADWSLLNIEDLNKEPWKNIIVRRYNGDIRRYARD